MSIESREAYFNGQLTHKPTPWSAFIGSFFGLGTLTLSDFLLQYNFEGTFWYNQPFYIASYGALCTLVFAAPAAPPTKLRNIFVGHFVSIAIAIFINWIGLIGGEQVGLEPGQTIISTRVMRVITPAAAISAMCYWKVVHPPAGAAVLVYSTLPDKSPLFMARLLIGSLFLVLSQFFIAKMFGCCREYEEKLKAAEEAENNV